MGCAPSASVNRRNPRLAEEHQELAEWLNGLVSSDDPENLLLAYIEIEKNILNEEGESPASVLSLAISRQQQIKVLIQAASEKKERSGGLISEDNSMHELFADLGLHRGSEVAAEHEEFIANINRKALDSNLLEILGRRSAAIEENIRTASFSIASLQMLYEKQDVLLGRIYGDAFGSEKEMVLEEEMDTIRNYRDAFSSGALLWKDSAKNVEDAAQLLSQGVSAWRSVHSQRSMERKITMATDARNAIQEAAILIDIAQDSMPGVQVPYCTKRELTSIWQNNLRPIPDHFAQMTLFPSVFTKFLRTSFERCCMMEEERSTAAETAYLQAIEYIFTDILIEDRYRHALQVYQHFHERAIALSLWINQVFESTLKKDLADIDRSILKVSKSLRSERIKIICEKLAIENRYEGLAVAGQVPFTSEKNMQKVRDRQIYTEDGDVREKDASLRALGRMFRHSDLYAEFEKNLAARRNAMWPSRRIEELQAMAFNGTNYS